MYGLPITREFEMNDKYDVSHVVKNFNECPLPKRYILATNIKKAFSEFNIKQPIPVEESNTIINFLNKDFVTVVESTSINESKLNEMDIKEFKSEVLNKINNIIDHNIDEDIIIESFQNEISYNDKINRYFVENDMINLCKRMDYLKQYGLVNDLDEIDILNVIRNLAAKNVVHCPKTECELGKLVCVNDNLYIICKQKNITNEYLLLSAETLDLKTSKKIVVENTTSTNNITKLIKKIKKMS